MESYDFSGKTIVPFATSGGSGMGRTVDVLKPLCPAAIIGKGKMLNRVSDRELEDWVKGFLSKEATYDGKRENALRYVL